MGCKPGHKWSAEVIARRSLTLRRPLRVRFERHYVQDPGGCWLWTGSTDRKGYGQLRDGGSLRYATHVSLELDGRPVPLGMLACHHCDTPCCVNPAHLFIGTPKDNTRDSMAKGRLKMPPLHIGQNNNAAVLTPDKVREIRSKKASGMSLADIARSYDVTVSCVWSVIHKRTWAHV